MILLQQNRLLSEPSTTNSTGESPSQPDPLDVVREVVIIFLVGVAVVLLLMLLTYLAAVVADRVLRQGEPNGPDDIDRGALSHKANLWGLRLHERERILEHLLQKTTFAYSVEDVQNSQPENNDDRNGGDIEMGVVATARDSNSKDPAPLTTEIDDEVAKDEGSSPNGCRGAAVMERVSSATAVTERTEVSAKGAECTVSLDEEAMDCSTPSSSGATRTKLPDQSDKVSASSMDENADTTNIDDLPEDLNDADHHKMCCICLVPYGEGVAVMKGMLCNHMFHRSCCQDWLLQHDDCPYCRKEMMLATELRKAAVEVLGERRVTELSMVMTPVRPDPMLIITPVHPPQWWARDNSARSVDYASSENTAQQGEAVGVIVATTTVNDAFIESNETHHEDSIYNIDSSVNDASVNNSAQPAGAFGDNSPPVDEVPDVNIAQKEVTFDADPNEEIGGLTPNPS